MKTTRIKLLIAGFISLVSSEIFAQSSGFHYGGRFALGESKLIMDGATGEESKLLISGGIATNYQFNRIVGIKADFLLTGKGGKYSGTTYESGPLGETAYHYQDNYKLLFGELPIMGKLALPLGENLQVEAFAGPSINFNLIGLQDRVYDNRNYHEDNGYYDARMQNLETVHYGMVYGAGIDVLNEGGRTLFLDFRLSRSMGTIGTINGYETSSNYFMVGAGYMF